MTRTLRDAQEPVEAFSDGVIAILITIMVLELKVPRSPTIGALREMQSKLAAAVGKDRKGLLSIALYACAMPLALVRPVLADALFVAVALIWLIPDTRIERVAATVEHSRG